MPNGANVPKTALSLIGITRRFGRVPALDNATMLVHPGTVHALLGENGAGKTTLMRVAFGMVQPDAGEIALAGKTMRFASPSAALAAGMGMVHQHFTLVPAMTVAENVALGGHGRFSMNEWATRVRAIGERTGLVLDPFARVSELPVGAQQRCEIVKALAHDVRILILDEPTAVLAPAEAEELLRWVKTFVLDGHAVVLITHKLRDALAVASNVTVLRLGKSVLNTAVPDTNESELAGAMLGSLNAITVPAVQKNASTKGAVPDELARITSTITVPASEVVNHLSTRAISTPSQESPTYGTHGVDLITSRAPETMLPGRSELASTEIIDIGKSDATKYTGIRGPDALVTGDHSVARVVLRIRKATFRDKLGVVRANNVSLDVRAGEIVGVAAVEGAGQRELLRLLSGRLQQSEGDVQLPTRIGFVPEDRHNDALLLDRSLVENVALRDAGTREGRMPWDRLQMATATIINTLQVRTSGVAAEARTLSGGNQQKLIFGREIADQPQALVVENPTRGLDFRAASAVHDALRVVRAAGAAVVVYSSDLDEVLSLADRVVVMHAGRLTEVAADRDIIGRAMLGA